MSKQTLYRLFLGAVVLAAVVWLIRPTQETSLQEQELTADQAAEIGVLLIEKSDRLLLESLAELSEVKEVLEADPQEDMVQLSTRLAGDAANEYLPKTARVTELAVVGGVLTVDFRYSRYEVVLEALHGDGVRKTVTGAGLQENKQDIVYVNEDNLYFFKYWMDESNGGL